MKKGEETRDRLLRCAEKAFSKKGFYETQVSDIVKLAHVAKGTIYQYFKNKDYFKRKVNEDDPFSLSEKLFMKH